MMLLIKRRTKYQITYRQILWCLNSTTGSDTSDDIEMNHAYLKEMEDTRQGVESDEIWELKKENMSDVWEIIWFWL